MNQYPDARLADELDAAIRAFLAGAEPAPPSSTTTADIAFVGALVGLGHSIAPDATFAAELEARLVGAPATGSDSPPDTGTPGNGHANGHARALPRRIRRLTWRGWLQLAALVLLALLLITPPARAGVASLIRIGAVRIGLGTEPSATPAPHSSPTPLPTPLPSLLDLAGATTLAQARAQAGFPIHLPTYPPDLGPPQYVYLQQLDGPMVALVWTDPAHPSTPRLALFEMTSDVFVQKSQARVVAETTVDGQPALWTEGPYFVAVYSGGQVSYTMRVLVNGHVLVWEEHGITYRLETTLPLDQAVQIAESLR
ncbi:MAG: hypothetical protein OJF49_002827 [Ktedonobacterales bacterium]|jgi:hypothetical protein|nr:MAG: hypothetical protein OJF49_002827 [Ktedonobacterales bacterium]